MVHTLNTTNIILSRYGNWFIEEPDLMVYTLNTTNSILSRYGNWSIEEPVLMGYYFKHNQ